MQGSTRREYYGALIAPLEEQTDLVVLPETFTSGFSNEAIHHAETMDGPSVAWLREQAARLGAAVTGGVWMRAGLNRAGVDGNDLTYSGDSGVLDFLGQPLAELGAQKQVVTVRLDPAALARTASARGWMRMILP